MCNDSRFIRQVNKKKEVLMYYPGQIGTPAIMVPIILITVALIAATI